MKKLSGVEIFLNIFSSFIIMLCIGSVYSWSLIASRLIKNYKFFAWQTQLIFGILICIFPVTMIFAGKFSKIVKNYKIFGYIAGSLFLIGYLIAGYSNGNFILILLCIGFLVGIATGSGYWVSLTSPVQLLPNKKGLITGIVAAGFGLGSALFSEFAEMSSLYKRDILEFLKFIGIIYGVVILIFSNFISFRFTRKDKVNYVQNKNIINNNNKLIGKNFLTSKYFIKLFAGIFLGTFAGLLIIGNLKIIGEYYKVSEHFLILGISIFSISNFLGRIIWGYLSDHIEVSMCIFLDLFLQFASIFCLNYFILSDYVYLIIVSIIGFSFAGNFVLFAKKTATYYGVENLGIVYPYVFLGYAIAGVFGPISGGFLYDVFKSFKYSIFLASFISLIGSIIYLIDCVRLMNKKEIN